MAIGIHIEDLKVRSLDTDHLEVSWSVASTTEDVLDYTFQVLRSESPSGPWDEATTTFEDKYSFVDSRIPHGDHFRQLHYLLRVTKKVTSESRDFGPAKREPDADLAAQNIRVMEATLFREAIGRLVWFFPKRTFGTRCGACYDEELGQKRQGACLTCYGTGYQRGYHNPIEVFAQIDPAAKSKQLQSMMQNQEQIATARIGFYPEAKPGDLIVEAENKRWVVSTVQTTERLRAVIHQELVLKLLPDTDIEYRIPINHGEVLKDYQPSPPRMFTLPQGMHNVELERVPDAFALFPEAFGVDE